MDMGFIINLITGAIGGNIGGAALKDKSLGMIFNTIAGAVGGVAGVYLTQAAGLLGTLGLADVTLGSIVSQGGVSLVSGGIVTWIIGFIKNKLASK